MKIKSQETIRAASVFKRTKKNLILKPCIISNLLIVLINLSNGRNAHPRHYAKRLLCMSYLHDISRMLGQNRRNQLERLHHKSEASTHRLV